jgi:hypothetical protein
MHSEWGEGVLGTALLGVEAILSVYTVCQYIMRDFRLSSSQDSRYGNYENALKRQMSMIQLVMLGADSKMLRVQIGYTRARSGVRLSVYKQAKQH